MAAVTCQTIARFLQPIGNGGRNCCSLLTLIVFSSASFSYSAEFSADDLAFFETHVRPVLVDHCQGCHGPEKQEAGLRLDSRAAAIKGGDSGSAIEAGNLDESLLVEAIRYTGDIKMPPKKKLSDDVIATLTEWVRRGAPWPLEPPASMGASFDLTARKAKQWAFQPIVAQAAPEVNDANWPKTSVDRFILAGLEAARLRPAEPADKRSLLRRVTFDLIGLPPTPAEVDSFLDDEASDAFERVVDRLLASPHYGERWGRHWLDLVRYAETLGHEFDFEISHAHEYRDYLIRALNADVPYERFVIEHVAGDLLAEPRLHPTERFNESPIATGFWFLGEAKHSPVDVRADEADRVDNQIDVFAKTFLGQTLACARCHDHKFDALSTKDYYALKGYLQSSRRQIACVDSTEEHRAWVGRLQELCAALAALMADTGASPSPPSQPTRDGDILFADFTTSGYDGWFADGDAFGSGPVRRPNQVFLWPGSGWPSGARGLAHSGRLSLRLEGALRSPTFTIDKPRVLYLAAGQRTQMNLIVDGIQILRDPLYGQLTIALDKPDQLQWYEQDVNRWIGHNAYIEFIDEGDGFLAVEQIVFSDQEAPAIKPVAATQNSAVPDLSDPRFFQLDEARRLVESQIVYRRKVLAMTDGTGEDDFVHLRGNPNKFGDVVPRRFLEAIAGTEQPGSSPGSGRHELAQRMVDPANPLVARVIVNRLWQHHFGEGLVRTPDDFGNMGQPPTHPELLDHLATELVRHNWSLKQMHRLLLGSSVYRMSSRAADPAGNSLDPQNRLWHRMNLRRLEAEAIRDSLLAVSGRLNRMMSGPGVPPHLTPFMAGLGRPKESGPLDGNGRRSIYLEVRRNFLSPLLLAFDYPIPFTAIGKRGVSNVPAQALALMNNPLVIQQSRFWAERLLDEQADSAARLRAMYLGAFGREPSTDEQRDALAFVEAQSGRYADVPELNAWSDLAHVLFNMKEFMLLE